MILYIAYLKSSFLNWRLSVNPMSVQELLRLSGGILSVNKVEGIVATITCSRGLQIVKNIALGTCT